MSQSFGRMHLLLHSPHTVHASTLIQVGAANRSREPSNSARIAARAALGALPRAPGRTSPRASASGRKWGSDSPNPSMSVGTHSHFERTNERTGTNLGSNQLWVRRKPEIP